MSKKYKHGLIIGKFFPFTRGHQYLIDSAREQCDRVTVLVCSLKNESIPGEIRYEWIKEHYRVSVYGNDLIIKHVTDEVQQYPHNDNDENFWDIWTGIIMREMRTKHYDQAYDVIFTSEDYGKQLSERTQFKYPDIKMDYVDVDKARTTFPVSGTLVRENPFKQWDYLPDVVKPYFMKKIVFVGPESVGKSFSCSKMGEEFNTITVPEFGRSYTDYLRSKNEAWTERHFTQIAKGQINSCRNMANDNMRLKKNDKMLIMDTDVMITEIWGEIYFRKTLPEVVELESEYIQKGDLYILLKPDIPWVDDGTRDFPQLRKWHYKRILDELVKRGLNYVVISGDFQQRLDKIKFTISNFMRYAEDYSQKLTFTHNYFDEVEIGDKK